MTDLRQGDKVIDKYGNAAELISQIGGSSRWVVLDLDYDNEVVWDMSLHDIEVINR